MKSNRIKRAPKQAIPSPQLPEPMNAEPPLQSGGFLTKVAAILFGTALILSFYLAWQSAAGKALPGCGPGSGCGQILQSRWSVIGNVPVSLLGAAAYGCLFFFTFRRTPLPRWQGSLEKMLSVVVLGGAIWFVMVQAFILKAFCPWCCTAHLLAGTGVVALWISRPKVVEKDPSAQLGVIELAVPLAAVAALALLQSQVPEVERLQEKSLSKSIIASPGTLSLYNGRMVLDPADLPSIGLPNSTVTAVALTDFTCPHCRELHQTLTRLTAERPGQLQTILLPASFDPEARQLHRIMLSLWRIKPDAYHMVSGNLADGLINPTVKDVLAAVQKQVDGKFYELAWAQSDWVQDTLRKGEELMALNGKEAGSSTLPQLLIRDRLLTGTPHFETLVALLDGAPAPATAPPTASPAVPPTAPIPAGKAEIIFDSLTIDLGTVIRGDPATKHVTFTNTGSDPLIISAVKPSCGCTTVHGGQQAVDPGKQGSFELSLDTGRFIGDVAKTVDVESNASNGVVRLTLKSKIWSPVTLVPPGITFGSVIKGTKVEPRVIAITVSEPEPLNLGPITCSNPYFQTEMKTIEEGRKYQLTISVPELGDQPQDADIVLQLGHPKMKEMKLSTFVNPVEAVVVQPAEFVRSAATLKSSPTSSVTIFCHDPALETFDLTDLAFSGGGGVTVSFEHQANAKWGRINLTFPPDFDPAAAKDTHVSFHTNHPRYPQITVPVRLLFPPTAVNAPPAGSAR